MLPFFNEENRMLKILLSILITGVAGWTTFTIMSFKCKEIKLALVGIIALIISLITCIVLCALNAWR